ncbi:lipopolysaccharide kinase InaA family protein [Pseudomonas zhanjiangensis]|uniref:Lipopolysaccharide kinase InaA family protein n=1 Tax=Pseudomonas zhanjiangensis TaxID=3239015 RepID=A0ABV3YUT1_9PSED
MSAQLTTAPGGDTDGVFARWWQLRGEWVEAPNRRRGGESGVQRLRDKADRLLYIKRQVGHLYRSWRRPLGRPTVLRELEAMQALEQLGIRVPRLVYAGAQKRAGQWRALLVSEALHGFVSLEQWYADAAASESALRQPMLRQPMLRQPVLRQLALVLSRLHRAGWRHGCLYPKHIFIRPGTGAAGDGVEVALLDLEKCRRYWSASTAARRDMAQLHRHRAGMPDADWRRLVDYYQLFTEYPDET